MEQVPSKIHPSPAHLSLILICALSPHHVDELLEVDGAVAVEVGLHDELEHLVLCRVLPDGAHHVEQLLRRDGAAPVLKECDTPNIMSSESSLIL